MTTLAARVDAARRLATGRTPIFYGWWIVASGFGTQTLNGALLFHAFGTYVVLLQDEFGWSRTALAGAFAMQRVESGLLGPVQGWMIDSWGPRRVMIVGMLIFGAGLMLLSRINSLETFYIAFLIIAIGSSLGTHFGATVAIVHWFYRRRAWALALMMLGTAAGGLLQPIVVPVMEQYGWRTMAFASGIIVLAVGLPLTLVIRHRPEDHGYQVDGGPPERSAAHGDAADARDPADEVHFTARQALRTRAFWFLALGHGSATLVIGAVFVHFQSFSNESLGFSLSAGAFVILLLTAMTVVGQLGGGFIADRVNKRLLIVFAMLGHSLGLLVLAFADAYWMLLLFAVLVGLGWGARVPAMQALRADYFGGRSFGTIMGFSSLIIMFGMILGPLIAGASYDTTGSYRGGFVLLASAAMAGAAFFWFARPPEPVAQGDAGGASVAQSDAGGASVAQGDAGGASVAQGDAGGASVAQGDAGGASLS